MSWICRLITRAALRWVVVSCALLACRAFDPAPAALPALGLAEVTIADDAGLARAMSGLARALLERARRMPPDLPLDALLDHRLRAQLVIRDGEGAVATLRVLRDLRRPGDPILADGGLRVLEIYATARQREAAGEPFAAAYVQAFRAVLGGLDDKAAYYLLSFVRDDAAGLRADLRDALAGGPRVLAVGDARELVRRYQAYVMYQAILPLLPGLIAEDDQRRYAVDDGVVIRTPHASLAALVFRPRRVVRGPAALFFTIYTDSSRGAAREAAAHGYIGVAVETRGKRLATEVLAPYEHEAEDTHDAIDWIAHQPWSDGQVGMWGNSYVGFAQWAATKRLHPALKTIVPSAAAIPGLGLPMENNVFLNANYGWAFYVGNHRLLDNETYNDRARWRALDQRWYESGRPYREIDQVDGTPNPLLQRWLRHPAYDAYWQAMVPDRADYAKIGIPILSITGYYDDGQISALHYLREHTAVNPQAEHYLLIGPYQHFSAQAARKPPIVGGYAIDRVAQINTKEIIFQWLDHVMRGAPRPAILADKINYQVMGADRWKHAASIAAMASEVSTLYLSDVPAGVHHTLTATRPANPGYLEQVVDLADRTTSENDYYYPSPVITEPPALGSARSYLSEPFAAPVSIDGVITGELRIQSNHRDLDVGVVVYEVLPDGRYLHLTYFLGRASYSRDMTTRHLLVPGTIETIPFERTRMISRQLAAGSRLLVVVSVNKNPFAQVNHGTGKDVSDESSADATPLHVRWYADSFVRIPIAR